MNNVYDDALMNQAPEEIPVIYAKRHLPAPKTYPIFDKSNWEGLKKKIKSGKVTYEIDDNFSLRVEGNADVAPHVVGFCKIPDTENNRRRLEFLSKPRFENATKIEVDLETGERKQVPCKVEIPPLYTRLDQSLVKQSALDDMWEKMKTMLEERGLEITQKAQPTPQPIEVRKPTVMETPKAEDDANNKLKKLKPEQENKPEKTKPERVDNVKSKKKLVDKI